MLIPYLVLGLSPSATQKEIRQRYLEQIRAHPPSRDAKRFQQISAAYEAVKDERTRISTAILGMARYRDFELALDALAQARPIQRQTPGLKTLLVAEGIVDE